MLILIHILECVQSRLKVWQSQLLTRACRATLIQFVIQAIPIDNLSTFRIDNLSTFRVPKWVCEDLDAMAFCFWLGVKAGKQHFFAVKAWAKLREPKEQGRLGFKSLY